jgi:hypothetical protein
VTLSRERRTKMTGVSITIHFPAPLWHAGQALAPHEGDVPTVMLRAVEEYVAAAPKRHDARDSQGKIRRDPNAVSAFKRANPKPPGCDRYEVDHIVPLSKGRRDEPSNTQWLPMAQHQDKTKRELRP